MHPKDLAAQGLDKMKLNNRSFHSFVSVFQKSVNAIGMY